MPSALETLVKILKLEREQGCQNRAVIGGFNAYSNTWQQQAEQQARRPEHVILVEELTDLMRNYEAIDGQMERMKQIDYMLERIVGRAPMPAQYAQRLEQVAKESPAETPAQDEDDKEIKKTRVKAKKKEKTTTSAKKTGKQKPLETYGYDNYQPVRAKTLDITPMPTLSRPPRKPRQNISLEEAREQITNLNQPLTEVKGIGQAKADQLADLNLFTIEDVLNYLPRRYDDSTQLRYISRLQPEQVATVIGTVTHTEVRVGRNNRKDFYMEVEDGSGTLNVIFFGQHFLVRSIRSGRQVVVSGRVSIWQNRMQMSNPEWEPLDSENLHTIGIVPVYPLTESVKARSFRRTMKSVVEQYADTLPDPLPESVLERAELADLNWALRNLHFPEGWDHLGHARRRYLFDQLLLLQLGILGNRRDWQSVPGQPLPVEDGWLDAFIASVFPYELTGAQQRSIGQIRDDVAKDVPMNRLLQGDVGAGKTAVALTTIGMALHNRKQAALMAPTSILAEQHYRGITKSLAKMQGDWRPAVALLTSALSTSEREAVYRGMANGSIDVVIGTHALIQEGVEFNDLGVAIIDEQHRFGVEQRAALRGKGTNPHLLFMTATPIPRTLAMTMYADLDLSIIDEKPPGRYPIETRMLAPVARERAFQFIEQQLEEGRQAFIVHPLVEVSDKIEARSAIEAYDDLQQVFYKYRVCLLHGRMSPTEKDEVMAAFANHEYDVMITTSVAEVGVDVPNASVMMIEGANRFGLAQLHQFRGRVGRGQHQSYCLLLPDALTDESEQRLRALEQTDDGFKLAEMDWQMRGAGDLLGTRQSGSFIVKLAEFMTPELVSLAQSEARTIYEEDPDLQLEEHALLAEMVQLRLHDDAQGDVS
ncbi:MAG: ATP-dependent DNA helicase RecG [Anaerolineae bacterium]|nr:ATP-dependent DNA helicase RecG [Anaerolineae bacterium]